MEMPGGESPYDNPERLAFCYRQMEASKEKPFIHSSVKVPPWVILGDNVTIYEGVVLGSVGFGYARSEQGNWLHIPHTGKLRISDHVDIFPYTTINRGTIGDTFIGEGTKIDHHCHIGHNSRIGRNVIICAGVIIAGSVIIGDNVWISPGCRVINKCRIANNTFIGQGTNVINDVESEGRLLMGNPARELKRTHLPHNKKG